MADKKQIWVTEQEAKLIEVVRGLPEFGETPMKVIKHQGQPVKVRIEHAIEDVNL